MELKIITETGDQISMKQVEGNKDSVVAVFKDSLGRYHHSTIDNLVESGCLIEYEGPNEGEDMEYVGNGFLV